MKGGDGVTDFDAVYQRYFKDVYKYMLVISRNEWVAEEVTQESFFKALNKLDDFDGRSSLYAWLCQIAKNTYIDYCRKQKKLVSDEALEEAYYTDELEQMLQDKETAAEIYRAMHDLEEPYKEVFLLRIFGELPFAQIAALFHKTESWARETYHRARLKIKEGMP